MSEKVLSKDILYLIRDAEKNLERLPVDLVIGSEVIGNLSEIAEAAKSLMETTARRITENLKRGEPEKRELTSSLKARVRRYRWNRSTGKTEGYDLSVLGQTYYLFQLSDESSDWHYAWNLKYTPAGRLSAFTNTQRIDDCITLEEAVLKFVQKVVLDIPTEEPGCSYCGEDYY